MACQLNAYLKTKEPIYQDMNRFTDYVKYSILDDIDKKRLIEADPDHYFQVDIKLIDDYSIYYKVIRFSIKNKLLLCRGDCDEFNPVKFYFKALSEQTKYNFIYVINEKNQGVNFYTNDGEFNMDNVVRKLRNARLVNCGHCHAEIYNLSKCADCRKVHYCNRECQLAHWPEHEKTCIKK